MKSRDVIFWMHLGVGVVTGVIILMMSVTGTILVFEPQITAWAERDMRRVTPVQEQERLSLETLVAKASDKTGQTPSGVTIDRDPAVSVIVHFGREELRYVHPYSGQVLGSESKMHAFMETVEVWHRWLGMGGPLKSFGHNIKAACNLAFFFMIISGVYLWWPRQWQWKAIRNIAVFNPTLRGRARAWNWHNVIGVWCAPLLMIITLTGVVMSYGWANDLLYRLTGNQPPARKADKADAGRRAGRASDEFPAMRRVALDVLVAKAQTQVPDWQTLTVRFAQKNHAPVTVMIRQRGSIYPTPRSTLTLDAATGEIKKWEPFSHENLGRRVRVFVRYLHTGEVGGVIGQTLAFIGALGACFLVWTGFALAWQRFLNWRHKLAPKLS